MIYTKFHKLSGALFGWSDITGNPGAYETETIGLIEGRHSAETHYVLNRVLTPRVLATNVSVSKLRLQANGTDTATISGLPVDCWLTVDGLPVNVATGSHVFSTTVTGDHLLELIGKYRTNAPLTLRAVSTAQQTRDNDPRWQQIVQATPAQIANWVEANVTNLATAKDVLVTLILAVKSLHEKVRQD